jgi:hypothetical protein
MTPEEKQAKAEKEAAEKAAQEKAEKEAAEKAAQEKAEKEAAEKAAKKAEYPGNYIMKVTHLSWGLKGKNHFFADHKPEINAKVMAEYASTLDVWLQNKWIEKGSY